jgi:sugar lactone lactonase YvrE
VHVFDADTGATLRIAGQPTDTSATPNAGAVSAGSFAAPWGLAANNGRLYVADEQNHRVLGFDDPAVLMASRLYGQVSFLRNGFDGSTPRSAGGGRRPRALARAGDALYVAETDAHRVVVFPVDRVDPNTPREVFGQPDRELRLPNAGGAPSARSLRSPRGVFVHETRVFVADSGNHRVLLFDRDRPDHGASIVLGQADFAAAEANRGGSPSFSTLKSPEAVAFDGTRLIVADTGNHRVLVWNRLPTTSGAPADLVLGQPDATATLPNRGTGAADSATLDLPSGVLFAQGSIWIADTGNNRVVRWNDGASAASLVLGQPAPRERTPASSAQERHRLAGPIALATDGVTLFVADRDGARVVLYPLDARETVPATAILDGVSGVRFGKATGLAVERGPLFTTRLWVADPVGEQITRAAPASRLRSP